MRLLHYSDIENAHDDPERVGHIAGLLEERRGADTLVCGTGDNVAPGVLPLATRGGQALDFFEAASPDLSTFGNHDFDFGIDRTAELVERSPQQWLSANVYLDGERFAGVEPWTVRTVDDTRVGFLGLTDPTTPSGSDSAGRLSFTDPIEETHRAVGALEERGADHVIVLSHLGRADDRLAAACDVDVILGGHVHSERIERVAGTLLTRPGDGGRAVLEVDLERREVTRHAVEEAPLDATLADRYRTRLEEAGLGEVLAHVEEPIARTEREAFRGESRVGNFVANAYRWAAERELGTDPPVVGLQNSGGIRTGPPLAGAVTVRDLVSLVPFEEAVAVVELAGAELRVVLREAAHTPGFGEANWWHAHLSGARVVYDYAEETVLEAQVRGETVDDDSRYRLAVSEFLLNTDAEFPILTERDAVRYLDTQHEVLTDYARSVGIDPQLEGRIVHRGL